MIRAMGLPVTLLTSAMIALAADPSPQPKSDEPDAFDIEPAILKQTLPGEPSPGAGTPDADFARFEKQLERAKQNAGGAERLYKIGVLAKVEVEQRLLKVVRCESDLANAQVARAKEEVAAVEANLLAGESNKAEVETAKATLAQLAEVAQGAAAKRERAELESAEVNLRRQQKLLKLGIARESDVAHAEEKLAELKVPKE